MNVHSSHRLDEEVSSVRVTTPNVELCVGDDHTIFGQPENPSGFGRSFTRANVKRILEVVGEECDRVFAAVPQELADLIPPEDRHIGIYNHPNMGFATAAFDVRNSNRLQQTYNFSTRQVTPIGYSTPEAGGILLNLKPDGDLDDLRMPVGHEAAHLVSMRSIHINDHPIIESLVARIERDMYGERDGVTADHDWDPKSIQHTSGFLSRTNFGSVSMKDCLPAVESMYVASYFASDFIRAEQVWKIWTILAQKTRQTGLMPLRKDVIEVISSALGDQVTMLFNNPAFRMMQTGMNHATIQNKDRTVALAHTFQTIANPQFGAISSAGIRQEIQLKTQLVRAKYNHHIQGARGQHLEADGRLEPIHTFTYDKLWSQFSRHAQKRLVQQVAATISGMEITIGNLNSMDIRKPTSATTTRASVSPNVSPSNKLKTVSKSKKKRDERGKKQLKKKKQKQKRQQRKNK